MGVDAYVTTLIFSQGISANQQSVSRFRSMPVQKQFRHSHRCRAGRHVALVFMLQAAGDGEWVGRVGRALAASYLVSQRHRAELPYTLLFGADALAEG